MRIAWMLPNLIRHYREVWKVLSAKESRDTSIMKILPVPFTLARYFGIWEPSNFSHRWKKRLYHLLSAVVLFTMYTFVASQLFEVIIYFNKHKGISETLYLLLTMSSACFKAVAFLYKKQDISSLGNMLLHDNCIAGDCKEKAIQKRFNDVNRYVTLIGLSLVFGDIILMAVEPLLQTSNKQNLPCQVWLPYSIENPYNYWLTYAQQIIALIFCGSLSTAVDNIVTGFMWQACAQFDILEHRFKALPGHLQDIRREMKPQEANRLEKIMLIRLLQHKNYIYLYVKNIMSIFSSIIFVQFCASSTVISFSIYQLSMSSAKNLEFAKVFLYLVIMLVEFFTYCWFANEVHHKSAKFAENVYKSNWMILNLRSWKMILFLIHRSSKPTIISCYNLVVLSLKTYVQILKLSYSAYNLLRK